MDLPNLRVWCNRDSPLLVEGAGLFLFFSSQNSFDTFTNNLSPCNTVLLAVFFKALVSFLVNTCLDFYCLRFFCFGAASSWAQIITYFLCHNNTICATKSQEVL